MKNIVFLGPPASGKGTQSKLLLQKKYDFIHIAAGDLLRDRALQEDEFGTMIKNIIDNGNLVEDWVMLQVLEEKMKTVSKNQNIIFDGYPRKISQAQKLDEVLTKLGRKVDLVINLNIKDDAILERIEGRLMSRCGESYHEVYKKPVKEDICDVCGQQLYKRKDDNKESFKQRIVNYYQITSPLIQLYKERSLIRDVDALQTIQKVGEDVESIIKEYV